MQIDEQSWKYAKENVILHIDRIKPEREILFFDVVHFTPKPRPEVKQNYKKSYAVINTASSW